MALHLNSEFQMKKIKIAIIEDHTMIREALTTQLLKQDENLIIIGTYSNGKAFIESLKREKPDIILLDVEMPIMDGIQTLIELQKLNDSLIKTLILSIHQEKYLIIKLLELGANGIINKSASTAELLQAIHSILNGEVHLSQEVTKEIIQFIQKSKNNFSELTEIEIKIIQCICAEKNSDEIANELSLSINTVNSYRSRILEKTESKNIVGLVLYAIKTGIFQPNIESN